MEGDNEYRFRKGERVFIRKSNIKNQGGIVRDRRHREGRPPEYLVEQTSARNPRNIGRQLWYDEELVIEQAPPPERESKL